MASYKYRMMKGDKFEYFDPKDYLDEYYSKVGIENRELLKFHAEVSKIIFSNSYDRPFSVLELGGGPTIYQLISISNYNVRIDFSDYLQKNLDEVSLWLFNNYGSKNWDEFIKVSLKIEGLQCSEVDIEKRKKQIQEKFNELFLCDIKSKYPIGIDKSNTYDLVGTQFVSESITDSKTEWSQLVDNCISLIKPGGYFIMCSLVGAREYRVGNKYFPAVNLSSQDILSKISLMGMEKLLTNYVGAEDDKQGYAGLFMVLAKDIKKVSES